MKSSTIYSDKDLVLRVVTERMPEAKDYAPFSGDGSALQRCKDSSVPFEDQWYAKHFLKIVEVKPDTFYTVQEFEYEVIPKSVNTTTEEKYCVARIVAPSETEPESFGYKAGLMDVNEGFMEEIYDKARTDITTLDFISWLSYKFTITRKQ